MKQFVHGITVLGNTELKVVVKLPSGAEDILEVFVLGVICLSQVSGTDEDETTPGEDVLKSTVVRGKIIFDKP